MPKFKNKITNEVIEENLIYYVNKLRKNPNFEEIKEQPKTNKKVEVTEKTEEKE